MASLIRDVITFVILGKEELPLCLSDTNRGVERFQRDKAGSKSTK